MMEGNMTMKPGISVCMIVKNEEANLPISIPSILPWATEICVYDTGSTDSTCSILSRYSISGKLKYRAGKWENDFSKARNHSLDMATCKWIVWLDADDYGDPSQHHKVLNLSMMDTNRCFHFQITSTQQGQKIGGTFFQMRMFPNFTNLRFERSIHEQIIHSIKKMGLHEEMAGISIYHRGYENKDIMRSKAKRNLEMSIPLLYEFDSDPYYALSIYDSLFILDEHEKAINVCDMMIAATYKPEDNDRIHSIAHYNKGSCLMEQKLYKAAVDEFTKTHKINPHHIEAAYKVSLCLYEIGEMSTAVEMWERMLSLSTIQSQTMGPWTHNSVG